MEAYLIRGGRPLAGTIAIHGAKNSALPILAATLVTGGRCIMYNCPEISDVETACAILRHLGCEARRSGDAVLVDSAGADRFDIPYILMQKMRAAVIFLGALLARFGQAEITLPGGCALGERPIDLHLMGLRHMGAEVRLEGEHIHCRTAGLEGCTIALPFPSVGATENLILAALGSRGTVTICNAAKEPEITDLIGFLQVCGAEISGAGSSMLRITGGCPLHGGEYTVMPDRMEAATYLAAAAATRGVLTLERVRPEHLTAVLEVLRRAGCELTVGEDTLHLACRHLLAVGPIHTAPYDGFPTDAQAPVMAAMAVAEGYTVFEETIFEDRYRHVPALCSMGAKIRATRRYAIVEGVGRLRGAELAATDLRGGAAMVIAALCAQGESLVTQTFHMERGYAHFVRTLRRCGAEIEGI